MISLDVHLLPSDRHGRAREAPAGGNGNNDAAILVTSPLDALDLLLFPKRVTATLRR